MSRVALVVALCSLALAHAVQYGEGYYPTQQDYNLQPRFQQVQQVYPGQQMYTQDPYQQTYQPMPMYNGYDNNNNFIQADAYRGDGVVDPNAGDILPPATPAPAPVDATTVAGTVESAVGASQPVAVPVAETAPAAPAPVAAPAVAPPQAQSAPAPPQQFSSNMNPEDKKLSDALMQVQSDLLEKGQQVKNEAKWIQDVEEIMNQYNKKIANVHTNIEALKVDMKDLLKKKRQIQNIQIQRELEGKLESAQGSLEELNSQLDSINKKSNEFSKNRADIQTTIDAITSQIDHLQGSAGGSGSGTPAPAAAASPATGDDLAAIEQREFTRLAELRARLSH